MLQETKNQQIDVSSASLPSEETVQVLLVGPSFSGGGAERRFTNIAVNLFAGKSDIAVLVSGQSLDQQIDGDVIDLGWHSRLSYLKSMWIVRQRIKCKKYKVVMAFGLFPCLISILASFFLKEDVKLIVSEITRPKMEARNSTKWRMIIYNTLRKIFYGHSDLITANSIDGLRETCELADVPVETGVRVVNVIDSLRIVGESEKEPSLVLCERKYFICIGRLDLMKRIDTAISAFGILADHFKYDLLVVGDGEARHTLERQVENLGIKESVKFTGMLENPFPLLKNAAGFILTSEYEGYSNSLLEAMFCDVPVITSFCSSDAREMCSQGAALGFEVADHQHLAEHIVSVVTDNELNQKLIQCARQYRAPHALENAIPFYEELVLTVANGSQFS